MRMKILKNRRILSSLPLPESISSWQGVEHHPEIVDDPADHDGRSRSFKHERGNWATLVYVDYVPSDSMRNWMKSLESSLPMTGNTLFEQLHISLTRTLILKFHWIESIMASIKELCQMTSRFILELNEVKVYCNEDRTRTFLGVSCRNNDGILKEFTEALNKILTEYELPPFYEDASHHISFLWTLDDKEEQLKSLLSSMTRSLNEYLASSPEENSIMVNTVHCKVGNRLYTFQLK
ncbi:U6 snRNA phosphodiesterase isoform X2 [Orussus abietinus]|uniref:U6 snRNA phosphodiesterase isoform X2 n=1 Tax=Orussus abietinus TaxID=222816 RepID=UPI000C716196|nr:U6 snRNA phosphodiesterase isoform X2 [Orussus abietinus]